MARSATGESVLSRAVRIFDAFAPGERVLSVSQIARRARLHLATASRLIAELEVHGLLDREPDRRVRLGKRMRELALRASPPPGLRTVSLPFMADAHAVLGHHVQLGVLDGDEVAFVERLSAADAAPDETWIAGRLPLHASAAGLVLLAFGGRELTEAAALSAAVEEVRKQGYAVLPGQVREDALGVAVPIRAPARYEAPAAAVAALAAVVPVGTDAGAVAGVLATAAHGIGRALGAIA
jgi:DNA-binding IclR family transcriptional regulator